MNVCTCGSCMHDHSYSYIALQLQLLHACSREIPGRRLYVIRFTKSISGWIVMSYIPVYVYIYSLDREL